MTATEQTAAGQAPAVQTPAGQTPAGGRFVPAPGAASPVAPMLHRPPWPRVSITNAAKPAAGNSAWSDGRARPPP